MSIEKKSLISTLKTTKKANAVVAPSSDETAKGEKAVRLGAANRKAAVNRMGTANRKAAVNRMGAANRKATVRMGAAHRKATVRMGAAKRD
jgi:hypothetical protein